MDTHADARGLARGKVFLSVGHDEYWSLDMYQNVKSAIDAGVHAAFFCGNSVDGVLEVLPNAAGAPVPHDRPDRKVRPESTPTVSAPTTNGSNTGPIRRCSWGRGRPARQTEAPIGPA